MKPVLSYGARAFSAFWHRVKGAVASAVRTRRRSAGGFFLLTRKFTYRTNFFISLPAERQRVSNAIKVSSTTYFDRNVLNRECSEITPPRQQQSTSSILIILDSMPFPMYACTSRLEFNGLCLLHLNMSYFRKTTVAMEMYLSDARSCSCGKW